MAAHGSSSGSPHGGGSTTKHPRVGWSVILRESAVLIRSHRHRLLLGLGLLAVSRAAALVPPASAGFLLDTIITGKRPELLPWLAGAVLLATLVQAATGYALSQLLGVAAQRAIHDLRQELHWHVLRLPISRFDASQSGQLVTQIMNDAEGIRNLVGTGIVQLIGGAVTAVAVFVILLILNWQLTLAVAGLLVVFGIGTGIALTRLRPVFRQRSKAQAEINGRMTQVLGGIRAVKAYAAEPREQEVFSASTDKLFAYIRTTMTGFSVLTALGTLVIGAASAILVLIGGNALIAGTMTSGQLFMYVMYVALMTAPVLQIAAIGTQLTEAFVGLDRIRELRAQETEDADAAGRTPCPPLQGRVELDAVVFGYDPARPVLHGVSLVAEPGQTVALVGPSGSGKTTLVSLIMGFHRPQGGRILLDGKDFSGIRLDSYRRQLGVVLQDNVVFDGTVRENLLFAKPQATDADLRAAAQAAAALGFIEGMDKGWDTIVGERGVRLSGGQRQRLAIARALLADPRILILDEATSSLDSESESEVQAALARLRHGRTTFVIAHRLSTIRAADQILVLDSGNIVERGTHDALLAANGLYRRLHDRQAGVLAEQYRNPGEA
ncbi:MAG: ABC transporter ATP-binding protein [Planctomycetota bacterium]